MRARTSHGITILAVAALSTTCMASVSDTRDPATDPAGASSALHRVAASDLCVTNGVIASRADGSLVIDSPSSRAVLRFATAPSAEIRFRYVGPSAESKPLASGELRRQIGLKLRAEDSCNLVYIMWHIEPDAKIAVLVKRNPGSHSHAECHAHGYVTIRPRSHVEIPPIRLGESHSLRADLRGDELTVAADGRIVWQGALVPAAREIEGPVGLRTDNARFELQYLAPAADPSIPPTVHSGRCVPVRGA